MFFCGFLCKMFPSKNHGFVQEIRSENRKDLLNLCFNSENVCSLLSRTELGKYQLPWSEIKTKGVCAFIWEPGRVCVKPFRRVQSRSHGIISTKRIYEWKQRKHWLFRGARKREVNFFVYSSGMD